MPTNHRARDARQAKAQRIVTHVTEVKIALPSARDARAAMEAEVGPLHAQLRRAGEQIAARFDRVASMLELLERHGFATRAGEGTVHCFSRVVEALEAKRLLTAAGFQDREFQIVLEYERGWGML